MLQKNELEKRPAATAGLLLRSVSLRRGSRQVLQNLSLEMREARIGLVGLNGSGKSSLARLLNGLLRADEGEVLVGGVDAAKEPKLAASRVGFLFQNPDHQIIFPTVGEDIAFGLRQQGAAKEAARATALEILREYRCEGWIDRPVSELSEGQKHLVCLLSVLVMQPDVLVLDEPFSSVDLAVRTHLMAVLGTLPLQVILISHDLDVYDGFDRLIWLDGGGVKADGPPATVLPVYRKFALNKAADLAPQSL
ncbi:ABC transporter ATP-binding protein [Stappia sp. F7233]|uniref:ABC transporter ATP-binding protein n=1 Tax=Stappia albiluteola TaxID=2758565 RepID=A0A839AEG7_9HYPH|nr:ABC transporter ATP-binding protein [Stappia albiluteola]MBA5777428.1 ABC transporter ATP-binding protein [Stappia albiluteola]